MSKHINVEYHEKQDGLLLKSIISSDIQVTLKLTLPRCLMPSYWKFSFLSKPDVQSILEKMPPREVWLLGLAIGAVTLAPSSFRTSYTHLGDIQITSKANVITRILGKFEHLFAANQQNMLDTSTSSLHHDPALPKFYLTKPEYDQLASTILPELSFFGPVSIVNKVFHYRLDSQWIAVAFEGESLYALRIVLEDIYKASKREKKFGIVTKMPLLQCDDEIYAVLCDDGALFGFH
jgi:hypothetical protein